MSPRKAASVKARFFKKVRVAPADACWQWLAGIDRGGYGDFWLAGNAQAHRVAYELQGHTIPDGWEVDHLCRNRACVNPSHLEAVTPRENTLRSTGNAAENARKTHCPKNHPYDEANTYIRPGRQYRECRACAASKARRRRTVTS